MSGDSSYQAQTVTCVEQRAVHLALSNVVDGQEPETLCGEPVESTRPALTFLVEGCLDCALIAIELGLTTASDAGRAAVNIPRFVAGRRA